MHSSRIKSKEVKDEERKEKEALMAQKFKAKLVKALKMKADKVMNEEALKLTADLLQTNPDFYTLWNYRKLILKFKKRYINCDDFDENLELNKDENKDENKDKEDKKNNEKKDVNGQTKITKDVEKFNQLCFQELLLIEGCLQKQPKSYPTWFQRMFVIKLMPNPDLKKEISACDMLLKMDGRNFHCWDYRRFICKFGKVDLKDEIDFTLNQVKQDFSNFSSYFYRSALLTEADKKNILKIKDIWDKEYDIITTAVWVDPNDQSAWYYHGWLLSVYEQKPIIDSFGLDQFVKAVLFHTNHKHLIFYFNQAYTDRPFDIIKIWNQSESLIHHPSWIPVDQDFSYIWYFKIEINSITAIDFTLNCQNLHIEFDHSNKPFDSKIWFSKNVQSETFNKKLRPLNQEKIDNLKLLLSTEPENKWVNLAVTLVDNNLDENLFIKLKQLDPIRKNYYNDQKSKGMIGKKINEIINTTEFNLSNQNLTCLYYSQNMIHLKNLDLSSNCFRKISKVFNNLISLETLILDNNEITKIENNFKMVSLKFISLKFNRIRNEEDIIELKNCPVLKKILLFGNDLKDIKLLTNLVDLDNC